MHFFICCIQGSSSSQSSNNNQGSTSRQQVPPPPPASISPQQGTPKVASTMRVTSLMGEAPLPAGTQTLQIETHEVHSAATAPLSKYKELPYSGLKRGD